MPKLTDRCSTIKPPKPLQFRASQKIPSEDTKARQKPREQYACQLVTPPSIIGVNSHQTHSHHLAPRDEKGDGIRAEGHTRLRRTLGGAVTTSSFARSAIVTGNA